MNEKRQINDKIAEALKLYVEDLHKHPKRPQTFMRVSGQLLRKK